MRGMLGQGEDMRAFNRRSTPTTCGNAATDLRGVQQALNGLDLRICGAAFNNVPHLRSTAFNADGGWA